jgi:hypothetical protein
MHVENIRSIQTVYKNSIVTNEFTTILDDKTNKRLIQVTTHSVALYDNKGNHANWSNKHSIDKQV